MHTRKHRLQPHMRILRETNKTHCPHTNNTTPACRSGFPLDVVVEEVVVWHHYSREKNTRSHLKWDTAAWLQRQTHYHKFRPTVGAEEGGRREESISEIFRRCQMLARLGYAAAKWPPLLACSPPLKFPTACSSSPQQPNTIKASWRGELPAGMNADLF